MPKSRSSKEFWRWGIFVVLIIGLIASVTVAIIAINFSTDTVLIIFGVLSGVIFVLILFLIVHRMYKARPDLFYTDPQGRTRMKTPFDRFEYDKKEPDSPYASVERDSYQYKSRSYRTRSGGKKPFTDFTLNETTKCDICKLEIDKNEKIYRCPECRSPFHIEHLTEWLEENIDCPVCNIELAL
jgi:hypothetical protein